MVVMVVMIVLVVLVVMEVVVTIREREDSGGSSPRSLRLGLRPKLSRSLRTMAMIMCGEIMGEREMSGDGEVKVDMVGWHELVCFSFIPKQKLFSTGTNGGKGGSGHKSGSCSNLHSETLGNQSCSK